MIEPRPRLTDTEALDLVHQANGQLFGIPVTIAYVDPSTGDRNTIELPKARAVVSQIRRGPVLSAGLDADPETFLAVMLTGTGPGVVFSTNSGPVPVPTSALDHVATETLINALMNRPGIRMVTHGDDVYLRVISSEFSRDVMAQIHAYTPSAEALLWSDHAPAKGLPRPRPITITWSPAPGVHYTREAIHKIRTAWEDQGLDVEDTPDGGLKVTGYPGPTEPDGSIPLVAIPRGAL